MSQYIADSSTECSDGHAPGLLDFAIKTHISLETKR